ncbi:MAG: hypothetical protein ACR2P1_08645 [Pseudomonadales bacterium]
MKAEVFGSNHSPWVQAILLALHEKGIERRWGVLMPAVSIDGEPWENESSQILVKLGYEPISYEDLQAVHDAWQGVMHRPDNLFRFFAAFARDGDSSPSFFKRSLRNFLRGFIAFYMFMLINVAKWIVKPAEPENFGNQFLFWERALESSTEPFLDGDAPGIRDMLLFGMVPCHSSIPVPPLEPLRCDKRLAGLRQWITRMHERFRDYPHLHSGSYFKPYLPQPVPTSPVQRAIFYHGLVTMFVVFPVTIPLFLC